MKKWVIALVAAGSFAFAANASAVELVNPDGTVAQPYQAWSKWSKVTFDSTIEVRSWRGVCGQRRGVSGCSSRAGWVGIEPSSCEKHGWRWCRFALIHEIGHQFDYQMAPGLRASIGGLGGEVFADTFTHCHLGSTVLLRRTKRSRIFRAQTALPRKRFLSVCRELR